MSSVELFNFLKRQLGIITKRLEEAGVLSLLTYTEHSFLPEVEVTDEGLVLPVGGMLYKVKVIDGAPVYLNIDRPVTDREYAVVFPGSYRIIPRIASAIYLKAPTGYKSKVTIEALGVR